KKDADINCIGEQCERIEPWQKISQSLVVEGGKRGQCRLGWKSFGLSNPERCSEWRAINEVVSPPERNPVKHYRCDNFVRTTPGLEKTNDATPNCSCQYTRKQHHWDEYP